ncbi:unnamed protein product [Leptidea sinapis]|uniref:Uncharacterized protein n=1 Tax=Leptidea sinapis TaxID=189913 RepID=A0A5E4Q4X3_9NEOP|nr:unnamed protein product [Leptidea sinapis]
MYSRLAILVLPLFVAVTLTNSESLTVGTTINGSLVHMEQVSLSSIPLKTRTKSVFYNGQVPIKGITVLDLDKSKASVKITAGGIGSTYVNLKLKSERGDGLNYQIQIFA